jgi:CheY-like chemotaxis protein
MRDVGAWVELEIWDTGAGIPATQLRNTAKPLDPNSSRRAGLEMQLVKHLAELHGGGFHIESEEGKGTRFTVSIPRGHAHLAAKHVVNEPRTWTLPSSLESFLDQAVTLTEGRGQKSEQPAPSAAGWSRRSRAPRRTRRILISLEAAELRRHCERLLGEIYSVETVAAREAAGALIQNPADVFLIDAMPDSWGVLRAIRSKPATAAIAVIMLSVNDPNEERVRALNAGADDFIVTPFTTQDLLAHIESQIGLTEFRNQTAVRERHARKLAEAQWQTLQQIVDLLPVGIMISDAANGQITLKNKKLYQMLGEGMRALRSVDDIHDGMALGPDGLPITREQCPMVRSSKSGEAVVNEVQVYHRGERPDLKALINTYTIRSEDGTHTATVLAMTEIEQLSISAVAGAGSGD